MREPSHVTSVPISLRGCLQTRNVRQLLGRDLPTDECAYLKAGSYLYIKSISSSSQNGKTLKVESVQKQYMRCLSCEIV